MGRKLYVVLEVVDIFLLLFSATSCGKKEKNLLVGEWELIGISTSDATGAVHYEDTSGFYFQTFEEDGGYSNLHVYLDVGDVCRQGTYTVSGNTITYIAFGDDGSAFSASYTYGVNEDTLTLSEIAGATYGQQKGNPSNIMVFQRVG